MSRKAPLIAEAASRLRLQSGPHRRPRPRRRDRVGQGQPADSPDDYAAAARRAPRAARSSASTAMVAALRRPTRRSSQRRGVIDFEDVLLLTVGMLDERRRRRRAGARRSTATSSWTSTRTSTTSSSACSSCGSASATTSASSVTPPDDLLLHRGEPAPPRRLPAALPGGSGRAARARLPLLAARSSGWPTPSSPRARRRPATAPCGCWPKGRPGRSRCSSHTPTTRPRPLQSLPAVASSSTPARRRRRSPSSSAPTRSPRPTRPRSPMPACPTSCGAATVSSPGRRCVTRSCCCVVRHAATTATSRSASSPATSSPAPGGATTRRPAVGRRASRWESLTRPRDARRRPRGDLTRRAAARARRRARPTGQPSSTRRRCRASRWRACTPPRASSGTSSSSSVPRTGSSPSRWPRGPRRSRRSAGCSTSASTRARRQLFISWSGARTPGARATRRVSRFLAPAAGILGQGARPEQASRGGGGAARRAQGGAHRPLPRLRRRARHRRASARPAGATPARRPTTRRPFERLRTWRLAVAREASVPRIRRLHRCHAHRDRRGEPADQGALSTISGVGVRKLEQYGADVLAILQGADPQELLEKRSATSNPTTPDRRRKKFPEKLVIRLFAREGPAYPCRSQAQWLRWPAGEREQK